MRYFHQIDNKPGLSGLQDDACELLDFSKLTLEASGHHEGVGRVQKTVGLV